ncbi:Hypothetical predicted protein [Cloeon dipterum]|uniref:Kazal-like domain-containing protein n=1 Tax=Cloeon dipterum TaxID=197152 RepID=A0A8S1DQ98_9INSE|nr:Hypothetical predicted protein [Cloeon dipterum]
MKLLSLVVFALVLVAAFAQGERDCSTKCQCSNVPNKTEFCGILGNKRRTFGSSCEMLCYNCQNKSNYKYQSSGKCPADAAAGAAQGAQGANSQKVQPAERSTSTTSTTTPQPSSSQKPKN